jgi:hypothetical protein
LEVVVRRQRESGEERRGEERKERKTRDEGGKSEAEAAVKARARGR